MLIISIIDATSTVKLLTDINDRFTLITIVTTSAMEVMFTLLSTRLSICLFVNRIMQNVFKLFS